jgi:hypothetical protein
MEEIRKRRGAGESCREASDYGTAEERRPCSIGRNGAKGDKRKALEHLNDVMD